MEKDRGIPAQRSALKVAEKRKGYLLGVNTNHSDD
jgi:hypothetical protein